MLVPLSFALLSACAVHTPRNIVPAAIITVHPAPPSIPCAADRPIAFHAVKPGQQDDRGNAFDTPETIAAIVKHNAARKAVCP